MKFSTSFLGLIAATTFAVVNSVSVGNIDTTIPLYAKLSKDCLDELQKSEIYEECYNSNTITSPENINEICRRAFSDKCKKFFEDPLDSLSKCKKDPLMVKFGDYIKANQITINTQYCTVNGDGKICPSIRNILTNSQQGEKASMMDCAYKSCVDNQIKFNEIQKNYSEFHKEYFLSEGQEMDVEANKKYFDELNLKLKSQECTSQSKNDTATVKMVYEVEGADKIEPISGASTIKVIHTFLTLLLIYVVF